MNHEVRNLLLMILDENIKICCLCLKILQKKTVFFHDEIALSDNSSIECGEMLCNVLGESIVNKLSDIGTICHQCSSLAANSFKFIQNSKQNSDNITQVIEHLETLFGKPLQDTDDCKTLYISLSLKPELSSSQIFDNVDVNSNITNAFQRYKTLTSNQTKPKVEKNFKLILNESPSKMLSSKPEIVKNESIKPEPSLWHQNAKVFSCPNCPETFTTANLLRTHKNTAHNSLICIECGKQFNHPYALKLHEQGHYLKYICQDCGRVYKNPTTLRLHYENNICQNVTRSSPAKAKFMCDYCKKKYSQKMSLRVHIQHEHLHSHKSHECKWCKKKFWCQSRLKAHIVKHTKERNFLCETCNKKFVTKESLLYHTRIHTGEKPYECPHCNDRFLSASRRMAHIRSQHEHPKVECDRCHSKFTTHNVLFKHLKSCNPEGSLPQPFSNQNLESPLDCKPQAEHSEIAEYKAFQMPPKKSFDITKYPLRHVQMKKTKSSKETVIFAKQERNEMVKKQMQFVHQVTEDSTLVQKLKNLEDVSEYVVV